MIKLCVCRSRKYQILLVLIYGLVLQNFLEAYFAKWFGYFDELISAFFLLYLVINLRRITREGFLFKSLAAMSVVVIMAILSTLMHPYQPISNSLLDLFANTKFVMALIGGTFYFSRFNLAKFAKKISYHVKLITTVFILMTVIDLLFGIFPDTTVQFGKFGLKPLCLIYAHPATLAVVCLFLLSLLCVLNKYGIKSNGYIVSLILMMIMTMRAKIIGTLAVVLAIYVYVYIFKKKITIKRILIMVPIVMVLAWGEIQSYYLYNTEASRLLLTKTSLQIAKDLLPLGSGLATFASSFSKRPYSPIYQKYGLSEIWGLSMETGQDISDTFWPMILGQFGIIALIAYLIFVFNIFKRIQKIDLNNRFLYLGCWILFSYLLVASTSESAFVNAYGVYYAAILSVYINSSKI